MSKLHPPYIEGTIPAFSDTEKGTVLTVPFSMNRAVSKSEVSGFSLALKTIQQDKYFINATDSKNIKMSYDIEKGEVYFDLSKVKKYLKVGQHYKVQIAYKDNKDVTGYYSTVGIVKYTAFPTVSISNLQRNTINKHSYSYIGSYNSIGDITEKVYTYKFIIYDNKNNIIHDTGYLIHNNSNDLNAYESFDEFLYTSDLEMNKNYYIKYIVRTNNNMEISSPKYKIVQRKSVSADIDTKPLLELNYDNGYVKIKLDSTSTTTEIGEISVSGVFLLSRTTNMKDWEEVYRFSLSGEHLSQFEWKDFTIEQGKTYIYSLQQYNDYNLYSERILSKEIYVDFEDAFLFDGKRQLKIRYNPKISSFKTDHLESKIDTIGSKFPFIFRNGNVAYKEFPISGLISYQMDEDNLFMSIDDLVLDEKSFRESTPGNNLKNLNVRTTNLVSYNISAERDFKLEVLDWLNNGEPKLFRSPTEGNYIVRLMNNSLSPEDTLGRMLHSFSSTAYEIAECNYSNLNSFNFITVEEPEITQTRWATINLFEKSSKEIFEERIQLLPDQHLATSIHFQDMMPGDKIYIDNEAIVIGPTGTYYVNTGSNIYSIEIPSGVEYRGSLTYSYQDSAKNTFNTYSEVTIDDIPARQFIGAHEDIVHSIEDIKTKIINFYYLLFEKRSLGYGYAKWTNNSILRDYETNNIILYRDSSCTLRIDEPYAGYTDNFEDPLLLYSYKLDKIDFRINNGNTKVVLEGYQKIKWPENTFDRMVAQKQFAEELASNLNHYYIKEKGSYTLANSEFNVEQTYYEKKPFECYWDSFNGSIIYLSENSYEQIEDYMKENNCKVSGVEKYLNKAVIDDNEIDVTDSIYYIVKSLSDFEKIQLYCGVVLSCGYQLQYINYGEENNLKDNELIKNLYKLLNTTYQDSIQNSHEFYSLVEDCNIDKKLKYNEIISQVYIKLNEIYPEYIKQLEEVIK